MFRIFNDWKIVVILCLTLGLAPFSPEPHLLGKIKWIAGGVVGMKFIDWVDFFEHFIPFLLLFRLLFLKIRK